MEDLNNILNRIEAIEDIIKTHEKEIEALKEAAYKKPVTQHSAAQIVSRSENHSENRTPVAIPEKPAGSKKTDKPKENLELKIGGTWINRIGILAIIFALAYFLKYAFDNGFIGPMGRVMIGIAAGIVFLFLGERIHKKYPVFAQGITGGGLAFLFFSIFASFKFYNFIGQLPAFGLLILVTATAAVLSLRYNHWSILVLGVLSGFLTPFMLNTGKPNDIGLLTYFVILDLGVLAVAFFKKWRFFNYLSYLATLIVSLFWLFDRFFVFNGNTTSQFWIAETYLTVVFLIFLAVSILYNVIKSTSNAALDYLLIVINAGVYFLISYNVISDIEGYKWFRGLFAIIMSIIYFMVSYLAGRHNKMEKVILAVFLGTALTFITLAVPIQLDGNWITLSWAMEGVILLFISFTVKYPKIRIGSVIVLVLTVIRLLFIDLDRIFISGNDAVAKGKAGFLPMLNTDSLIFLAGVIALFAASYLYSRNKDLLKIKLEKYMVAIIAIGANILAILLLIANTSAYFDYYIRLNNINYLDTTNLNNIKEFLYSAILIIYSLASIVTGIAFKIRYLRLFSFVLFLISIVKVFFIDLSFLREGYRIMSFVLLGIILLAVSFLYQKFKSVIMGVDKDET